MSAPEEEKFLMTQKELEARLVTLLAGRAAEEIVFDTVTTGASNDMEKATDIARAMITQFGMSKKFGLVSLETVESKYLDGGASFNCSEETQAEIDKEIREILKAAYEESKRLLIENREVLDEIATFLYEKETITGKQFMEIFHRVRGDEVKESEKIKNSEDINDSEKVGVIETSEIADTSESVEKSEVSVGSIEQSEVAETSEQ